MRQRLGPIKSHRFKLPRGIRVALKTSWVIETRWVLSGTFGVEGTKHQRVSLKTPLGMGGSTYVQMPRNQ